MILEISKYKDKLTAEQMLELEDFITSLKTEAQTKETLIKETQEKAEALQKEKDSLQQENGKLYLKITTQREQDITEQDETITLDEAISPFKK